MDVSSYCRELEAYLCRKNDGHLIRLVGPAFETVSRWMEQGIPLKVAMAGIDRYFERYYRKGPRRRPVRMEFCEADVLDLFDEWRRATGVSTAPQRLDSEESAAPSPKRGSSLPEHLERVLLRLSSLRATGTLTDDVDPLIDRISTELDTARSRGGVRGAARAAALARLEALDAELLDLVRRSLDPQQASEIDREAGDDLAPFRSTMSPEAYEQAARLAAARALRERLHLPEVALK
jgi:hypothetical protein